MKACALAPNRPFSAAISACGRALVVGERVLGRRARARPQVGVQVGVAEAVDRLLRDRRRGTRRLALAVDARRRSRTAADRCPGTRRSGRPGTARAATAASPGCSPPSSAVVEVVEHVVEGDHAPLALAPAQRRGRRSSSSSRSRRSRARSSAAGDGRAGGEQGVGGVEERVRRASSGPSWCRAAASRWRSSSGLGLGVDRRERRGVPEPGVPARPRPDRSSRPCTSPC